jgi:hypothetical protein
MCSRIRSGAPPPLSRLTSQMLAYSGRGRL